MECKDFEPSIIQEKRILRLCKRLDKFSFDEISTIADDVDESALKLLLLTLVSERWLVQRGELYFYNKKAVQKQKISILKYYSPYVIDITIRCFCESLNSIKASHIANIGKAQAQKLYTFFRTKIYERQKELLKKHYSNNPQNARHRKFFEKEVYLYIYENQVFISKKLLKSKNDVPLNSRDKMEFTRLYCYLVRNLTHNQNVHNLEEKIAELLWRRSKTFEDLYTDLKKLIT